MDEVITTYKVYVKTNADGIITAVNSSAFLPDVIIKADKWTEIDEGTGDRFHHAQGNYLDRPLVDENGIYNYKLVDSTPVLRADEDKQPERNRIAVCAEMTSLKAQLAATDYIAAKLAEVAGSEEEYAAIKEEYAEELAQRAEWRAKINELEAQYG